MLFAYDKGNGKIFGVLEEYTGRREPSKPIPKEAYKIHGITDKEVKGKQLEYNRIESLIQKAEFLVAHNASFDREFVSNLYPVANQKQWRCSMGGVAWRKYGYKSAALQNLLQDHKIKVPQAHRANLDIEATLLLLSQISEQGKPYFFEILQYNKRMPNRYIDAKRIDERKVDELIGICKGVTADGVLTVEEVQILVKWLENNKNVTSKWPGNILAERIKEIVSDGIIDENELTELFEILKRRWAVFLNSIYQLVCHLTIQNQKLFLTAKYFALPEIFRMVHATNVNQKLLIGEALYSPIQQEKLTI